MFESRLFRLNKVERLASQIPDPEAVAMMEAAFKELAEIYAGTVKSEPLMAEEERNLDRDILNLCREAEASGANLCQVEKAILRGGLSGPLT